MGSSLTACGSSTSIEVGYDPRVDNVRCEESFVEHEQCASSNVEKIGKIFSEEDFEIPCVTEKNDLLVQELGIALCGNLHVHDPHEFSCVHNSTQSQDEIYAEDDMLSYPMATKTSTDSSKYETSISPEVVQSNPSTFDVTRDTSGTTIHFESISKPNTPKLVPAMKGSRAQQGKVLQTKLSVKWAPDVYDPPVSSSSHTVKGHHHRTRAKGKDHSKHKRIKGSKFSCGSNADRKHLSRRSSSNTIDTRIFRLQAFENRLISNGFGESKVEALDYPVGAQELKCGSSICMESLAPVHISLAEAS